MEVDVLITQNTRLCLDADSPTVQQKAVMLVGYISILHHQVWEFKIVCFTIVQHQQMVEDCILKIWVMLGK
jgi:hypothetical protein